MFEITLPFALCISLLTYQQKVHISLLSAAHGEEGQPVFSVSENCSSNFSIKTVWTLSGKDTSVDNVEEDTVVTKMEILVKVAEYYMAVNKTEIGSDTMTVFLTADENNATRFIPNPETTYSTPDHGLLDISQPFFFLYEQDESSYLLHCLENQNGTVRLFLQRINYQPPIGAEPVYAIRPGMN